MTLPYVQTHNESGKLVLQPTAKQPIKQEPPHLLKTPKAQPHGALPTTAEHNEVTPKHLPPAATPIGNGITSKQLHAPADPPVPFAVGNEATALGHEVTPRQLQPQEQPSVHAHTSARDVKAAMQRDALTHQQPHGQLPQQLPAHAGPEPGLQQRVSAKDRAGVVHQEIAVIDISDDESAENLAVRRAKMKSLGRAQQSVGAVLEPLLACPRTPSGPSAHY